MKTKAEETEAEDINIYFIQPKMNQLDMTRQCNSTKELMQKKPILCLLDN